MPPRKALVRATKSPLLEWMDRMCGLLPAMMGFGGVVVVHAILQFGFSVKFPGVYFFLYLMAILMAAWCGYLEGLLVVAFSVLVLPFAFFPNFSLAKVNIGGALVLTLISLIVSWISAARRKSMAMLEHMNEELERRVSEQTAEIVSASAALEVRLAELEALYRESPVGLCFLDQELRFARINDRLARLAGKQALEHMGRTLTEMFPPGLAKTLEELAGSVLRSGESIVDQEVGSEPMNGIAGERFWLVGCSPVVGERGRRLGVQVTVQDISDLKRAQLSLLDSNRELRQLNEELEQFSYSVSHDLREPLRMVSLFTQMLQQRFADRISPEADEYIGHAARGAQRMDRMLCGLLSFMTVNGDAEAPEVSNSNDVMRRVLENLNPQITAAQAVVQFEDLPQVAIHESHLEQLLQNLVQNAIKYRGESIPKVSVRASVQGDRTVFVVQDNGMGIDEAFREQIFGLFKRLHGQEELEGTGIGLAICQKIVRKYNGRIWVESDVGKGSRFYFELPLRK